MITNRTTKDQRPPFFQHKMKLTTLNNEKKKKGHKQEKHTQKKKLKRNSIIHNFKFHFISHLVVSGWKLLMGVVANEKNFIDNSSKPTTDKWAGPVDPVVGPAPAHNSWPK